MGRMTATVHDSAQAPVYARLQEGSDAPDFTLPAIVPGTAENGLINLSDVLEDGRRVVLYFYPAAMTPGCTLRLAISEIISHAWSRRMLRCSVSPRIHSRNCASSPSTTISHSAAV